MVRVCVRCFCVVIFLNLPQPVRILVNIYFARVLPPLSPTRQESNPLPCRTIQRRLVPRQNDGRLALCIPPQRMWAFCSRGRTCTGCRLMIGVTIAGPPMALHYAYVSAPSSHTAREPTIYYTHRTLNVKSDWGGLGLAEGVEPSTLRLQGGCSFG